RYAKLIVSIPFLLLIKKGNVLKFLFSVLIFTYMLKLYSSGLWFILQLCNERMSDLDNILKDLSPSLVFKYFEEISRIPRGSENEKAISDYLVDFARERNLEVIQDDALNVIIKKGPTKG